MDGKTIIMNVATTYSGEPLKAGQEVLVSKISKKVVYRWVSRGLAHWSINSKFKTSNRKVGVLKKCKPTSIIIPVHDCLDYLRICLNSLTKYTNNYELIIIDNGSDDKTKNYINKLKENNLRIITNDINKGFGYACNQGIKVAKYSFICFLNSDTVLTPNWLYELQTCFVAHKDCGIASPSTCFSGGEQCNKSLMAKRDSMSEDDIIEYSKNLERGYKISDIFGFCMITKKKILSKIGVFDWKRYGLGNSEEIDLMWRLEQVGYKNYWAKGSYVHHYGHKTFDKLKIEPFASVMENRRIFAKRKKDNNLFVKNDAKISVKKHKVKRDKRTDVIIPVLDRPEETLKTLTALFKDNSDIDVTIIDNGSTDISYLANFNVTLIKNVRNMGTIKALNQGLEIAESKYIVMMHNDIVVEAKDWIRKSIYFMEENPDIGMVGGAGWKGIRENGMPDFGSLITAIKKYNRSPKDFAEVAILDGSCNVIRNIGLRLDEIYGLMHFYDYDLCMQYRQKGYKMFVFSGKAEHFAEDPQKSTRARKDYLEEIGMKDSEYYNKNSEKFLLKWKKHIPMTV